MDKALEKCEESAAGAGEDSDESFGNPFGGRDLSRKGGRDSSPKAPFGGRKNKTSAEHIAAVNKVINDLNKLDPN